MPRGGLRPRLIDGSTDHLLKAKWRSGATQTIRVPITLADRVLELAHQLDSGDEVDLTQDNKELDKEINSLHARNGDLNLELDNCREKLKEFGANSQAAAAIALLQNAVTPKSKGGSYAANNATGLKKLVEEAIALLETI